MCQGLYRRSVAILQHQAHPEASFRRGPTRPLRGDALVLARKAPIDTPSIIASVQKAGNWVPGSGCPGARVPGAGCRAPGAGRRVPGAGCRVPGAGCRVPGAGLRAPGAGPRGSGAGCQRWATVWIAASQGLGHCSYVMLSGRVSVLALAWWVGGKRLTVKGRLASLTACLPPTLSGRP
jgi:hypothetical protein